jgi:hypothetical protein
MPITRWTDMAKLGFPLEVLAENYLAHLEGNGRSPHTLTGFRRVLNAFQALLLAKGESGTKEDLCPEAVAAYRAHLIAKKYALSSVRFYVQVLKAWSAYLTEEQVYRTDPLPGRPQPRRRGDDRGAAQRPRGQAAVPAPLGEARDQASSAQAATHFQHRLPEQWGLGGRSAADPRARIAADVALLRPRDEH